MPDRLIFILTTPGHKALMVVILILFELEA